MNRLYTRTGDQGTTAIHGGTTRVPKTDIRIEANGALDQLNVSIGIVRSLMPLDHPLQADLKQIQLTLMDVMSLVATTSDMRAQNPRCLPATLVQETEALIDRIQQQTTPADYFILPGGTPHSAFLHQARVDARLAERRLWALHASDPVPAEILQYVNRLSDLFFAMARYQMQQAHIPEEQWQAFAYRKRAQSAD